MSIIDEAELIDEMRLAVCSDKLAGDPTGWVSNANGHDSLIQVLPLDVQSTTTGTARLIWRAVRHCPDRDVSVTLVVTSQGRDLTAWRMDWRPHLPHTNTCGPSNLKGLTIDTGIHEFDCNARLGLKVMQSKNLPICTPVDPEPHDFDAFVRYVCKTLNVALTEQVLGPPWSPTLF